MADNCREKKALYSTILDNSISLAETAAASPPPPLLVFGLFFVLFCFYLVNFTGLCFSLLSVWHN